MGKLLKFEYQSSKSHTRKLVLLSIAKGILIFLVSIIPGIIANNILLDERNIIRLISILFLSTAGIYVISPYLGYSIKKNNNNLKNTRLEKAFSSFSELPLSHFEDKSFQNNIHVLREFIASSKSRSLMLAESIANITVLIMFYILIFIIDFRIFIVYIFYIFLNYLLKNKQIKSSQGIWARYMSNSREHNEISKIMIDKDHAHERILFRNFPFLNKIFINKFKLATEENLEDGKNRLLYDTLYDIFLILILASSLIVWIYLYSKGRIRLGILFVLFSMTISINHIISSELEKKTSYGKDLLSLAILEDFLRTNNKNKRTSDLEDRSLNTIEFINVYFKYPNSEDFVIKDFSYNFKNTDENNTFIIVGENGSGKSTLIKLMLGLYKPDRGKILVNGLDASKLSNQDRKKIFSVLFQYPSKYPFTIAENIALDRNTDLESVEGFVKSNDKDLYRLVHDFTYGFKSTASEQDDEYVGLSGGQWQKIFFLRNRYSKAPISILDEPTSNLDPLMELSFYNSIKTLAHSSLNIFISHRLGITRYADTILVIKDGQLLESGSLKSLIEKKGEFYEMYRAQSELYKF